MYFARIENDELVLKGLHIKKTLKEGDSSSVSEMEKGDEQRIPISELSKLFFAAQSGTNDAYITLRVQPSLFDYAQIDNQHIMIIGENIEINALFNTASSFIGIDTLTYGIPSEVITKNLEGYGHNLLTQALQHGVEADGSITVTYKDGPPNGLGPEYKKDYVNLSRAFILPVSVDFIVDHGEYRDIHFIGDRGKDTALPFHTREDEYSLKRRLGKLKVN